MTDAMLTDEPLFRYRTITLLPSLLCKARCPHCCIPLEMRTRDDYDPRVIEAIFSSMPTGLRSVTLSGGEPFDAPERLLALVRRVSDSGCDCHAVTNGRWIEDPARGRELLAEAAQRGLAGLALSVDAYREMLSLESVSSLVRDCQRHGVEIVFKGVGRASRRMIERYCDAAGLDFDLAVQSISDLERAGTAASLRADRIGGPRGEGCFHVAEPAIYMDGSVLICCSVHLFQGCDALLLGRVLDEPLDAILDRASRDFLLAALAFLGPRALRWLAGRRAMPGRSSCRVCMATLGDPALVAAARRKIAGDRALRRDLAGRSMLFSHFLDREIQQEPIASRYATAQEHQRLLADELRTGAYRKAIESVVRPGDTVLDLGCGVGILALFAARAGCRRVIAVERESIIDQAREAARRAGLAEKIDFVQQDAMRLELDARASVLVHEQIGCYLWDEGLVPKLARARRDLLEPGGRILPFRIDLFLAPCAHRSELEAGLDFWAEPRYGFDFRHMAQRHFAELSWKAGRPLVIELDDESCFLAEPALVHSMDLRAEYITPDRIEARFSLQPGAECTGMCGFFRVQLTETISFSTGPRPGPNNFGQIFIPCARRIRAPQGGELRFVLCPARLPEHWRWEFQLQEAS
ncbi:MAG: radical SAM protein [Deltaproteobacteria bacterium]|nr:radical SAM protein [Deltaproteobacteria bacterium]